MTGTEIVIVLAAIIVGSTVKSVTGMGLPIVVIPVSALFVDVADAVVVIALPNLAANGILAWRERAHRGKTRDLKKLIAFNVLGGVLGALAFVWLPERLLLILLIIAITAYLLAQTTSFELTPSPTTSARWAPGVGTLAGVFHGAIGISGPIVAAWVHSLKLPREAFVLSITAMFFTSGLAQFVVFAVQGELAGRLVPTLLACIPVVATIPLGARLRGRISSTAFNNAVLLLLSVSVISLVFRVLG